jgi:hypothetical protein
LRSGAAGFFSQNSGISVAGPVFAVFATAGRLDLPLRCSRLDPDIAFVMALRNIRGGMRHDLDTFRD